MSITQIDAQNDLLEKILNAPLGEVVTVLEDHLNCKIYLDLIEQNTPKPGTKFGRKIIVYARGLPLIRAIIKFDRKDFSSFIVKDLLQKQKKIGTILQKYGISNENNIVFLKQDEKRISRIYEIRYKDKIWFEISEEIMVGNLSSIQKEFPLDN
jgi:hypothetical protein